MARNIRHKKGSKSRSQVDLGSTVSSQKKDENASESLVVEWAKSLLVAVVFFLLIRTFVLQTFVITSGSMEDALLVGDFLIANRAAIGTRIPLTRLRVPGYSSPRRGDVLVFDPPHEPDRNYVKQLVGLPWIPWRCATSIYI